MDISPAALVSAATQMQQSQVAQTAQVLVLKKAMDIQATGALALLQDVVSWWLTRSLNRCPSMSGRALKISVKRVRMVSPQRPCLLVCIGLENRKLIS